jgi:hypothetical protein
MLKHEQMKIFHKFKFTCQKIDSFKRNLLLCYLVFVTYGKCLHKQCVLYAMAKQNWNMYRVHKYIYMHSFSYTIYYTVLLEADKFGLLDEI